MPDIPIPQLTEWRNGLDDALAELRKWRPIAKQIRDSLNGMLTPMPVPTVYAEHEPIKWTSGAPLVKQGIQIKAYAQQDAILIEGTTCQSFELSDSRLEADAYAIWLDCNVTRLLRNIIKSRAYYSIRGYTQRLELEDNRIEGHHSVRVYGVLGGYSRRNIYTDEYARLGGGGANEWVDQMPFKGTAAEPFVFENDTFNLSVQMTLYDKDEYLVFRNCDFTNCAKVRLELGAKNIQVINCPGFTAHLDAKGQTAAHLAARNIVIA